MKIENHSHLPPAASANKKPSVTQTATAAPDLANESQKVSQPEDTKRRMQLWFSRAGISFSSSGDVRKDTSRRVAKHQYLKAQRRLDNLEKIMSLSLEYSLEHASKDDIDPDWFYNFIDLAENIHSPAMQDLWAKIFAVEVGVPGTFSLKSLQTLQNLTHKDAKIFRAAVGLASRKQGEHGLKVVFGYHQKPSLWSLFKLPQNHQINLAKFGLAYPDILSLMDLGLLFSSEIETGEFSTSHRIQYRCCNETIHLNAKTSGLSLQYYKFTSVGSELAKLIKNQGPSQYLDDLKAMLNTDFEVH